MLLGSWPFLIDIALSPLGFPVAAQSGQARLWLAGMGLVAAVMLFAPWGAWTYLFRRARLVDDVLRYSPDRWSTRRAVMANMRPARQAVPMAVISGAALLYLVMFRTQQTSLTSYLCAAWTTAVGVNATHWLYIVTGVARRIYRCRDLNLRWQDPASTPGMRTLAEGYGVSALFLLAGVVTIAVMAFWLPDSIDRANTRLVFDVVFGVAVLLSFRVGPYAFFWLYAVIRRDKRRTLAVIQQRMPDLRRLAATGAPAPDLGWSEAYRMVNSAADLPFRTSIFVQYSAVLLGAVLAFLGEAVL